MAPVHPIAGVRRLVARFVTWLEHTHTFGPPHFERCSGIADDVTTTVETCACGTIRVRPVASTARSSQ